MKKSFNIVAIALVGVFAMSVFSCSRLQPDPEPTLILSTELLQFEAPAGTDYIGVAGAEWVASADQSWVTVSPTYGTDGVIDVTVTDNDTGLARKANVTVTNAAGSKVVKIEQAAHTELTLDPTSLSFVAAGETKAVTVTSESAWEVESNQTWLTVEKSGDIGFTAIATNNDGDGERTATITVTNAAGPKTVSVTQAAHAEMTLDPTSLSFVAAGETKPVAVTSASAWEVESDKTWLTVNKTGTTGFTATAVNNDSGAERTATITVTNAAGSKTVSVTQLFHAEIILDPTSLSFGAMSETKIVAVTSESAWEVESDKTWLIVDKTGDTGFAATATENEGDTERTATITVTNAAGSKTVSVTQLFHTEIVLDPTSLSLVAAGETKPVAVTSESAWDVESDKTWLTVNKTGTTGFTATAVNNDSGAERTATITVTNAAGSKTVSVTQAKHTELVLQPNTPIRFGAGADVLMIKVTSESAWEATSDKAWLTVPKGGTGFFATVEANSGAERTATITVTNAAGSKTISVTQEAPAAPPTANVSSFSFGATEIGSPKFAAITSSTTWTYSIKYTPEDYSPQWLNIMKNGNNIAVQATQNNESSEERSATVIITNSAGTLEIPVTQGAWTGPSGSEFTSVSQARYKAAEGSFGRYIVELENADCRLYMEIISDAPISSAAPANKYVRLSGEYKVLNTKANKTVHAFETTVLIKASNSTYWVDVQGSVTFEGEPENMTVTITDMAYFDFITGKALPVEGFYTGPLLIANPNYTGQ